MTIDPKTLSALQHQSRRMRYAKEQGDRRQMEIIHRRVDQLLDNRAGVVGAAPDGEVVYDNAGSWAIAQATEVVNNTDVPERVLPHSLFGPFDLDSNDDEPEPNGGGVGLLDRP